MRYRFKIVWLLATVGVATVWTRDAQGGLIYFASSPFVQASDSPFTGTAFSNLHRENFAHGRLNAPRRSGSAKGVFTDSQSHDSVSADSRTNTSAPSFHSDWTNTKGVSNDHPSHDSVAADGPTNTGALSFYSDWTNMKGVFSDIQSNESVVPDGRMNTSAQSFYSDSPNTFLPFIFDAGEPATWARDAAGVPLGLFNPFTFGDGHHTGESAEDRFVGAYNLTSISAIRTHHRNGAVDHRQYGGGARFSPTAADLSPIAVPEPATLLLLGTGLIAVMRRACQRRI